VSESTLDDARALLEAFERSDMNELRIRSDGFELHAYKSPRPRTAPAAGAAPAVLEAPSNVDPAPVAGARARPEEAKPKARDATAAREGMIVIRAPSLGTFYRAPKPGAPPFVSVGQEIEPTTEICIIEVMKLFTAVQAGTRGIVREILVSDGALVEHDQPLIVVEPTEPAAPSGT